MSEKVPLVVTSKVKDYIRKQGCKVSSEAVGAINDKLYTLLDAAVERTKGNKRSTLRGCDL